MSFLKLCSYFLCFHKRLKVTSSASPKSPLAPALKGTSTLNDDDDERRIEGDTDAGVVAVIVVVIVIGAAISVTVIISEAISVVLGEVELDVRLKITSPA